MSATSKKIRLAALGEKPKWACYNVHNWFGMKPWAGSCGLGDIVSDYTRACEDFGDASETHQRMFLLFVAEAIAKATASTTDAGVVG